jgi:hypothetical protein
MKVIDNDQNFKPGAKILGSNLNVDDIQFIFMDVTTGDYYDLKTKARFAFSIDSMAIVTNSELITVTVTIDSDPVTGLFEKEINNTMHDYEATAQNIVAVGSRVELNIVNTSDLTSQLSGNIKITRL